MFIQVLVIDDSPAEQLYIGHFLRRGLDVSVIFANDGAEAIRLLETQKPALIISDLRMPGMNGLEFVKQLTRSGTHIPVILMTSFGSEQMAVQALAAGAASYVPKRRIEADLVSTIKNVMAHSEQRRNRRRTLSSLTFFESHFAIDNDASSVGHLVSHLLDIALSMKLLAGQEQTHVGIALQEALSNAINHGNLELDSELRQTDEASYFELADQRRLLSPYAERKVLVEAKLTPQTLEFVITDQGPGFDPRTVADPTEKINLERIGGRGLLLINSFMDEVSYSETGNQIRMVKYVSSPVLSANQETPILRSRPAAEIEVCS